MHKLLKIVFILLISNTAKAINISDTLIQFKVTQSYDTSSYTIKIENLKTVSETINLYISDNKRFSTKATSINIAANTKDSFVVYFHPIHNLFYHSEIIVSSSNDPYSQQHIHLSGQGRYSGSYYTSTENKSEQELKNILKKLLAKNYNSLGYNAARDKMYMVIDNQGVNGRGASVNTLECVYTGRIITNYTSRQDAQSTPNDFNTEHTWPQSLFSSSEPMLSDLFHIMPTDNSANNKRANDPFGEVTNPTWQVGGSKWASNVFEPRDAQKARSARAMLYFAIRYQNYSGYLNSQESILKKWHFQFLPNKVDSQKNEDIYKLQKNRNPFIDHPELVERITSFSDSSYATPDSTYYIANNKLSYSLTENDTVKTFKLYIVNEGNTNLLLNNVKINNPSISLSNNNSVLKPGYAEYISGKIIYNPNNRSYIDTLWYSYGNINHYILTDVTSNLSVNSIISNALPVLYPNPTSGIIYTKNFNEYIQVLDLEGKIIASYNNRNNIDLSSMSDGLYIIMTSNKNQITYQKVLVKH
jgi:hypothetical protein